jgi:hypothetical protein
MGPSFLLIHGKFDADKLRAAAEQAAKDTPAVVKVRKFGEASGAEVTIGPEKAFFAQLDKETVVATFVEALATEAVEKALGKHKGEANKDRVREVLTKPDPKAVVEWAASKDMVTAEISEARADGRPGKVERRTLGDARIDWTRGAASLGENDFRYKIKFVAKDPKGMANEMQKGLDEMMARGKERLVPDLAPMFEIFPLVKIGADDDAVNIEGSGSGGVIAAVVKSIFRLQPKPDR